MIVNFTEQEIKERDAIEQKYKKLIADAEAEREKAAPADPAPDFNDFTAGIDPNADRVAWDKAIRTAEKAYKAWEDKGGAAVASAIKRCAVLMKKYDDEISEHFHKCERRQFSELNGNARKIAADFKKQVPKLIEFFYQQEKRHDAEIAKEGGGWRSSIYIVTTDGHTWKLYAPEIIAAIKRALHLHFDFAENNEKLKEDLTDFLTNAVYSTPYVANITQGENYTGANGKVEIAAAPDALPVPADDALQSLSGRRVKKVDYPIDKPNNNLWRDFYQCDANGQISFKFDVSTASDKKKGNQALILYSITFDNINENLKITKTLEPYDKRVYIAAASLYNAGNTVISIAQIYNAMGADGKPGKADREKIYKSMCKLMAAQMTLSNLGETQTHKGRAQFDYKGALLQAELMQARINGQIIESAFHLFREPPLISFARERKQITTFERKILQTPLNKTPQSLLIEDYLIDHITAVKSGRRSGKVLFSTIYDNAGIKTKMQRSRAPEKIRQLLTYWKEQAFINDFIEDTDGVTVIVDKKS